MIDFFKGQMDYILFFYGLAFIILAAVCFILMKKKSQRLPWGLLGLFGVTHGIHEWMELFVVDFGGQVFLKAASIFFMAISFLFLTEFGRSGVARVRGKGPGRWVFAPLLALTAMGGLAGLNGVATVSRYALGFTGGVWAALALFLESKGLTGRAGRCLVAGGIAIACYAVATGLIVSPAPFFPAHVFNSELFFTTFGFPVQLLRSIFAVSTAACLWAYSQAPAVAQSDTQETGRTRTVSPIASLLMIILLGWVLTQFTGNYATDEQMKEGVSSADILSDRLADKLKDARRTARERADSPVVRAALLRGRPEDMRQAAKVLDLCKYREEMKSPSCYLLDRLGKTIVSCNVTSGAGAHTHLFTKMNDALEGRAGGYYSFDERSKEWSYIAYAAVKDAQGRVIGVTLVKENLDEIEASFRRHPYSFLIDSHGVIFLSSSEVLCLKSLWPLSNETQNDIAVSGQFGTGPFSSLLSEQAVHGRFVTLDGQRLLVIRRPVGNNGWSLVLLNPTGHIRAYRLFAIFVVLVFCATAIVFFAVLYFTRESSARIAVSERALFRANEELELRVEERTSELVEANEKLLSENRERIMAEEELRKHRETLENLVEERTRELSQANEKLRKEIISREEMEAELLKAQKLESLGILAGGIAHDFNNLLTTILGNISIALLDLDQGHPAYLGLARAERATLRAQGLTQQLLTFSRGGAPVKKTMALGELIRESAGFALRGAKVRCDFTIPDDLWLVDIDEGQISQVIHNLVINADQAMPNGGTMTVRCENVTLPAPDGPLLRPGNYVRITVQDQGVGIPNELLEKIFDPYFTTKQRGSGLGLATTYSIVQRHNGCILAESGRNRGATFTLYLPASRAETVENVFDDTRLPTATGKILIMDDEEDIRETAGGALRRLGYSVAYAEEGNRAIELYWEAWESVSPFDVVIMDLTVPGGMGGRETLRRLLEIDPLITAIVSSGYSNDPVMADYGDYGFAGVVAKPYRVKELGEEVRRVLAKKRQEPSEHTT